MSLMRDTTKRALSFVLSVLMIITMLPISGISVLAITSSSLESDIADKVFIADIATEFTFTTKAGSEDAGKMVLGSFTLLDDSGVDAQSAVKTLEYWDVSGGCYREFYGDFGPAATGFPLTDATSRFRVTFNRAGTYTVKASMINFEDRSVVVSAADTTITVKPYASELTTDIDTKTFVNNTEVEFTYSTVANGHANTMVLGTFSVLDSDSNDAKNCIKKLEYWDVTDGAYREFYGDFGPENTGFPLTDATSKFRVTFGKAGIYTVNAAMKKFDGGEILCSSTKTITVQTNNSVLTTDIGAKNFEINEEVEFTYTTIANDFAGTMVLGKFSVKKDGTDAANSIEKLEYWDVTSGSYREFYGDFGPVGTGFPLTDATSKFRVTFKETGTYTVLTQMVAVDSGSVISENTTTIEVKDTKAPVITEVTGNVNEWTADDVTLVVNATDNSGSVYQYRLEGGEWQSSNEFTIEENGTYKFYAKDAAGNESVASAEIKVEFIDKIAPVIGVITLDPDDWTKEAVTVTVPATDEGIGEILYKMDDGEWQEENVFTIKDNETHKFYVKDTLGNENSIPSEIRADKYDALAPVITSVPPDTEEWVADKVVITVNATDEGVQGISYKLGKDGSWQSSNEFEITENGTYQVYVKDALGNESDIPFEIAINNIDKANPEIVDFTSTTEEWTKNSVTISGTVKDSQSGVAKLQYQIGDGAWNDLAFDTDGKFSITVSNECNVTYTFKCVDKVGLESTDTYSKAVKIDKTPASVTVNDISDTWKNSQISITGTVSDDASGIKSAVYDNGKGDSGVINIVGTDYTFDTNVTESGEYTYKITVTDNADNVKTIETGTVRIDLVNPVASVEPADGWTNQEVSVVVTATDDKSGISKVYYKKNGGTPVEIERVDGVYKFTIPNTENNNEKYEIYCEDNSGRRSESVDYTAQIDITAPQKPTITYSKALKYKLLEMITFGIYQAPVTVTISSSDDLSGLEEIKYYLNDEEHSMTPEANDEISFGIAPDNQYEIKAVVFDKAGNDSEETNEGSDGEKDNIGGVIVDNTPPVVDSATADITIWTNGNVVISGTVSDNLSGVEKVCFTKGDSTTSEEIINDGENFDDSNNYFDRETGKFKFTIEAQSYEGPYYIHCVDFSTNVSAKKSVDVKMDNVMPSVVKEDLKAIITGWTNNSITVTGKVSDNLSGVVKVYWRQGSDGTENVATLNDDGTYEFVISARNYEGLIFVGCYDAAGNKADEENLAVRMDVTKPVVDSADASTSDWTNGNVEITGTVHDEIVNDVTSGVVAVKYSYDDQTNLTATLDSNGKDFKLTIPKTNSDGAVTVWCVDAAGNESVPVNVRVRMDITDPQVDSGKAESAEWTNKNVVVSGTVSDKEENGAASQVKTVMYKYNGGDDFTAEFDGSKYTIEIPKQDYKGNVTVWCVDYAGNRSGDFDVAVKMDVTAPNNVEIKYTESLPSKFISMITFGFYSPDKPLTVTISAEDNLALEKIEYKVSGVVGKYDSTDASFGATINVTPTKRNNAGDVVGGYITFNVPAEFKGKIEAFAYDCAGNSTDQKSNDKKYDEVIVDSIAPDINISYEAKNAENTNVHLVDANNADVDSFEKANQALYNGDVNATITITENNFFEGEKYTDGGIVHEVGILVSKTDNNGVVTTTEYLPVGASKLYKDANQTVEFTWDTQDNVHEYTIPYDKDADYVITVAYVDFSGNKADIAANDGKTSQSTYTSKIVTVDKTAPVVKVEYKNKDVKATYGARQYYIADQFATITVEEHNFRADDFKAVVTAKYSDNTDVSVDDFAAKLADDSKWTKNGNTYTIELHYSTDANYTFDYTYEDLANNSAKEYVTDEFTVDKVNPENLTVTYDGDVKTSILDKVLNVLTFGYYDAKVKVTISAYDDVSGIDHFVYSYIKADGVSSVNASLENEIIANSAITQTGKTFTATFEIPKAMLQDTNQFNGTVNFTAFERSTRNTEHKETAVIIVDNIAPTATITYNDPVQIVNDVSYYAGNINATIVINEANFNSEEVVVRVNDAPVNVTWIDDSADIHTGRFTLTEDGDYKVTVNYTDRSKNEMASYESNQLTIDTKEPVINVSNVKHQSANNEETISFTISVTDINIPLENFKPVLNAVIKRDNGNNSFTYETKTIALGDATTTTNANGETVHSYTVSNLEADGYYSLSCTAVDYANHSVSIINTAADEGGNATVEAVNFSVNREGSVFWIETEHNDKYTNETFTDKLDCAYANDNVVIKLHEVNVDKVDESADKKTVFTLNDGSKSEDIVLKEDENYSKNEIVGDGGWYETIYTLDNDTFDHDGVYSLNVITYDKAGNSNVNTKTEAGTISFTLDRTNPVISANVNTNQSVRDTQFWVEFEIAETNLDVETIVVKLTDNDGKVVETNVEDLGNNGYRFLVESGYNYSIEISAKDLAGNESELYKVEHLTVSTNIFILWYANTPLFWGSIGGVVVLAGCIFLLIFLKKRKKNEEK